MKRIVNASLIFLALLGIAFSIREAMLSRQLSERYQKAVTDTKYFDNFSREEIIGLRSFEEKDAEDEILVAPLSSLDKWHFRWRVFIPAGKTLFIHESSFQRMVQNREDSSGPETLVVQARIFESRKGLYFWRKVSSDRGLETWDEKELAYGCKPRFQHLELAPLCVNGPVLVGSNEVRSFLRVKVAADFAKELELSESDQLVLQDLLFSPSQEAMQKYRTGAIHE